MKQLATTIFSTAMICIGTLLYAQTTITLQPDATDGKDAFTSSRPGYEDLNYGTSDQLRTGAWTFNSAPGTLRSYLEFDLSSVPTSSVISSATLTLTHDSLTSSPWGHSTLSGSNESYIRRITSSWDELTVTWNNQPTTVATNQATIPQSSWVSEDFSIDVMDLVQDIVDDPSGSYGFELRLATESYYRWMTFGSSDNIYLIKRPKLEVTYSDPVGIANEQAIHQSFIVSPNPATTSIGVNSANGETDKLEIYNVIGRLVIDKQTPAHVDISNLANGLYYVRIYNESNHIIGTSKFVKK